MDIMTYKLQVKTKGAGDFVDMTSQLQDHLAKSGLVQGQVTVFVVGSTAAITAFEYEPGLVQDMKAFYEKTIPSNISYAHDETWGDANGFSHVRAALQGPSLVIPFAQGQYVLGTWQQIVLAEFDHKPRQRTVVLQFLGK
ncbi:MAG TPA: secondary thiamine-phosphate synthase enzyme YjbQ [Candidatus Omnitrophota bacterium]|nr:secondary thiamine-phosphate synthase enzyme YjbQ [Candidatus Omnitrophota bacterium]HQL40858.1 secondary thiamine-phosphate synthase enzyme YjbQ [Candidatus Omnitrophota bacterium]